MRSICACAISSALRSRLTRASPNTFPKTVRNELPPVFGMCRNSTGFGRDSFSVATRLTESLVAKDMDFIGTSTLLFAKEHRDKVVLPKHVRSRQLMSAVGFPVVAAAEIFLQPYVKADK